MSDALTIALERETFDSRYEADFLHRSIKTRESKAKNFLKEHSQVFDVRSREAHVVSRGFDNVCGLPLV